MQTPLDHLRSSVLIFSLKTKNQGVKLGRLQLVRVYLVSGETEKVPLRNTAVGHAQSQCPQKCGHHHIVPGVWDADPVGRSSCSAARAFPVPPLAATTSPNAESENHPCLVVLGISSGKSVFIRTNTNGEKCVAFCPFIFVTATCL